MMWLVASLGVCIGVLAGMLGAGPSILTVLLLTRVLKLDLDVAIGTSLVVVAVMSLVALVPCVVERSVVWKPAVCFAPASMMAAFVAGQFARRVPDRALLLVFILCMMVAAVVMLVRRPLRELEAARTGPVSMMVLAASGLAVGCVTGLVSLGGGFAVVPLLVLFARTPVRSAIGASLLVVALNTLASLAGHLPHPSVDWPLAACLGGTEAVGGVLGVRLSKRMSATALRHAFAALMLAASAFMLVRAFVA